MIQQNIQQVAIENFSNVDDTWKKQVPVLKKRNYIVDKTVSVFI